MSTEHLLLALTNAPDSHAATVLRALNISLEQLRRQIKRDPCSNRVPDGTLKMTPRAERIIQITRKLAQESGRSTAGTHHLLVALLREGEGLAARVLHAV